MGFLSRMFTVFAACSVLVVVTMWRLHGESAASDAASVGLADGPEASLGQARLAAPAARPKDALEAWAIASAKEEAAAASAAAAATADAPAPALAAAAAAAAAAGGGAAAGAGQRSEVGSRMPPPPMPPRRLPPSNRDVEVDRRRRPAPVDAVAEPWRQQQLEQGAKQQPASGGDGGGGDDYAWCTDAKKRSVCLI